jgi:hypothetical protein
MRWAAGTRFAALNKTQKKSRWAQIARSGKKVMQFLSEARHMANVVHSKVILYNKGLDPEFYWRVAQKKIQCDVAIYRTLNA